MKRFFCVILALIIVPVFCGCSQDVEAELTFIYNGQNIHVTLEEEEAQKVASIFDRKIYDPFSFSVPACGFDRDISITINGRVYAIACDSCNVGLDYGNLRYFTVSEADITYIHRLFEKYGGHFPCI